MERVKCIYQGGKQIIFLDFRDCSREKALEIIPEAIKMIRAQQPKSALVLTDLTGGTHDFRLTSALKEFTAGNAPYVKASAVVGMTGMKKIIYDAVMKLTGRNIQIFEDIVKAKEWLSTQ